MTHWQRICAMMVHAYTAVGGLLAFLALVAAANRRFEICLMLLAIAFAVDGTDGYFARRLHVRRVLPTIDGGILDLVIDFITFAVAPVFLLWQAHLLPHPGLLWASIILFAAQYDFANVHPLKDRGLYTGLPALWNVYAFHVFYIHPPETVQMVVILVLAGLTFAPVHFICLSRLPFLRRLNVLAAATYIAVVLPITLGMVSDVRTWSIVALAYPLWYLGSSLWADRCFRKGRLPLAQLSET
ncbi:CDP-alcohol phosphatidyltransferase family protein [Dyella sp. 2HG41-7]|uniref:CDP-alcohol phosphatidyltransferase family protein n=1 Tax=Dyella sp. 2HG41-7 TaxID=2883239 RepID=UPI001F1FC3CD|nr:CDP-alcohol phosphatidyltransferase family protein [Dyella sp. 2HG41-7]